MEITGTYRFSASPEAVWDGLMDAAALKRAIPGCERLEAAGPGKFDITARVGMAAVRGLYRGSLTLSKLEPPASYVLAGTAASDLGSIAGEARIELAERGVGTELTYRGDFSAQGGLARLGARVLQGTASLLLSQFFKALEAQVVQRTP